MSHWQSHPIHQLWYNTYFSLSLPLVYLPSQSAEVALIYNPCVADVWSLGAVLTNIYITYCYVSCSFYYC